MAPLKLWGLRGGGLFIALKAKILAPLPILTLQLHNPTLAAIHFQFGP